MKIVVGLGNPGSKYQATRHNTGFRVLDRLAMTLGLCFDTKSFKGLVSSTQINGEKVLLLKPQTFMNASGDSVAEILKFYKINIEDTDAFLLVYDDSDLEPGVLRFRPQGSPGGHNGVKDIIQKTGTQKFSRLRIGIGRDSVIPLLDYVLKKYKPDELEEAQASANLAADAVELFLKSGLALAMNACNTKSNEEKNK